MAKAEPLSGEKKDSPRTKGNSSLMDGSYDADETAFLKAHRKASFWSSVFFALAGATFIGVLNNFFGRLLNRPDTPGQQPKVSDLFREKQTMGRMTGMMGFGAACMYVSNWLESKKTLLEWRMGGNKVGRKLATAENQAQTSGVPLAHGAMPSLNDTQTRADGKSWRDATAERTQMAQSR